MDDNGNVITIFPTEVDIYDDNWLVPMMSWWRNDTFYVPTIREFLSFFQFNHF